MLSNRPLDLKKMDAASPVDLQSVKALTDENALLRDELRFLRAQLLKRQSIEQPVVSQPLPNFGMGLAPPHIQPHPMANYWQAQNTELHNPLPTRQISDPRDLYKQYAQLTAIYEHSARAAINRPLGNSPPPLPSLVSNSRGLGDTSGSLKGQKGITALIMDKSCQLGSWKSAGGLEWYVPIIRFIRYHFSNPMHRRCKLQLADTHLVADFTIQRPEPSKQLQVTYSVQFLYNGEILETVSLSGVLEMSTLKK